MKVSFAQYNEVDGRDFTEALKIYYEAFPANERQPLELIKKRIQAGRTRLYLGYADNEVVCMSMMWYFEKDDFVLLDYLAVKKNKRHGKAGSAMFRFVTDIAKDENKNLLLEIEHPSYGPNRPERRKRMDFYIHNGAFILKNATYYLPSLNNTTPTEMLLLIVPLSGNLSFHAKRIVSLIKSLYSELYEKEDNDELLQSFIHKIPEEVLVTNKLED